MSMEEKQGEERRGTIQRERGGRGGREKKRMEVKGTEEGKQEDKTTIMYE